MNVCLLGLIFWSSGVSSTILEKGVFVGCTANVKRHCQCKALHFLALHWKGVF